MIRDRNGDLHDRADPARWPRARPVLYVLPESMAMPPLALALVLGSALLHATWNVLLSRAPRGLDTTAVATALGLVAWTPLALARWRVDRGVWPYLLGSAAFELVYFAPLNLAYARAPADAH